MKKARFWILMSVYLVLVLADGALTYYNTPDLSMEANPLVAKLGLGWGALFVVNLVTFALTAAAAGYEAFRYQTIETNEIKFTRYSSQIVYHRPDRFWMGVGIKDFRPILASVGYALPVCLVAGRAIIVMEWVGITFNIPMNVYYRINQGIFFGKVELFVAGVLTVVLMLYWLNREFKAQLPAARQRLHAQLAENKKESI